MKDPKGRTKPGFEHHIFICENKRDEEHPTSRKLNHSAHIIKLYYYYSAGMKY